MLNVTPGAQSAKSTEDNTSDCDLSVQKPEDTKKKRSEKRRRETGDSMGESPKNTVNLVRNEKKKVTRKPYGFMQSSFWVIMVVHVMVSGD